MTDLEQIKSKIDLVEYIGHFVELKKAGVNHKGLCPFHNEKTPSFTVSADKQIWHCFGCGRGGDVFKFVMEKEGLEFVEALKLLAEQVGIELANVPKGESDERKALLAINEWAAKVYERALAESNEGRAGKQYLLDRGILPETIEKFRLGWAPASGRVLTEALTRRGYSPEMIEKAGLGVRKGQYLYDKFVSRVMFPLSDAAGRVVGFTGRVLGNQIPKYLNSPETPIFHKSEMLYGLSLAKTEIQKERQAILVEGQMDTIGSYQAGVLNTVGISGTALTEIQLQILSRYADELVLALDADAAGGDATKRAIELAARFDLSLRIATFGSHKDPGELIAKEGAEAWRAVVGSAVSVMDFYFDSTANRYDLTRLEDKKLAVKELLSVISKLTDPIEKDHYVKRLGRLVGVEPVILYDALKSSPARKLSRPQAASDQGTAAGPSNEETLAILPLVYPSLMPVFMAEAEKIKWASSLANTIYDRLEACYNAGTPLAFDQFIAGISEPERTNILELMLVVEQGYAGMEPADVEREVIVQLSALTTKTHSDKRAELAKQIAQAEQERNENKLRELLAELAQL